MTMNCPADAPLRRFLEGQAVAEEAEAIEGHLADCDGCQSRLHRWTNLDPEFLDWLAEDDGDGTAHDEPIERVIGDRLRAAFGGRPALTEQHDDHARPGPDWIGPYRIERRAGAGGMCTVFEAVDTRLNRRVALKMIQAAGGPTDSALDRFRREGAVLAALNHPNIVPVYEVGEQDGQSYLVLEFVSGGTLSGRAGGRPLPPREAARLVGTLAGAVQYAHEQEVIHRDLKPGNILLKPIRSGGCEAPADGAHPISEDRLMIADFGLARWRRDLLELTRSGQPVGTPAYMAPEQAAGRGDDVGPAVDIYALGVILYELLTGRPPFQAENVASTLRLVQESEAVSPRALQPGVPKDLETITLKCLEKDPSRRYESAEDLATDLDRFLEHRPIVARPVSPIGRAWRWCLRNPGFASVGMLSGVLLAALVVGSVAFAVAEADLRRQTELREQEARRSAAEARQARDLASLSLQRAMSGYSVVVDGVLAISPLDNPQVRSVRDKGHRVLSDWCVEYLDSLPPHASWTIADLQVALTLARVRFELDQVPQAEALLAECSEATRRLDGFDRRDPEAIQLLATSSMQLGNTLNGRGRPADALDAYELSDRLLEGLLRDQPGETYYLDLRFGLLGNIAATLARLDRTEEAIRAEREGIRTLEQLVETRPGDPDHPVELGLRATRLGRLHLDFGQFEDARSVLNAALKQFELVPADSPRIDQVRRAQIKGLQNRARASRNLGRLEEVVPDVEAALSLATHDRQRWELQIQRVEARLRVGLREGASEDAEALLADAEAVAAFPLEIANLFALLADDPSLPASEKESLARKAVGIVQAGISDGKSADPEVARRLFVDPDLAPLRAMIERGPDQK